MVILKTVINLCTEDTVVILDLLLLYEAKENSSQLGSVFLQAAGIVLCIKMDTGTFENIPMYNIFT